jgi:hypothetical protein
MKNYIRKIKFKIKKITSMNKTVYKVVGKIGNTLVSAMPEVPRSIIIQYVPGEWVSPVLENSCIFAFNSISDAKTWLKNRKEAEGAFEIWKAEGEKVRTMAARGEFQGSCTDTLDVIRKFWNFESTKRADNPPAGTVICERIKLLQKVG